MESVTAKLKVTNRVSFEVVSILHDGDVAATNDLDAMMRRDHDQEAKQAPYAEEMHALYVEENQHHGEAGNHLPFSETGSVNLTSAGFDARILSRPSPNLNPWSPSLCLCRYQMSPTTKTLLVQHVGPQDLGLQPSCVHFPRRQGSIVNIVARRYVNV